MQPITLKNSKNTDMFKMRLLDKEHILYSEWIGFISEIDVAQKACLTIASKIKETKVQGLLNDDRQQVGPWPNIDDWLSTIWIPAMADAGLRLFAHIHSKSVFTQLSANKILSETKNGIEFRHFENEDSAKNWLLSKITTV
jgi:hypothetical protein